jgi:hypothetical protein
MEGIVDREVEIEISSRELGIEITSSVLQSITNLRHLFIDA